LQIIELNEGRDGDKRRTKKLAGKKVNIYYMLPFLREGT
jgi:hypothetical protein